MVDKTLLMNKFVFKLT